MSYGYAGPITGTVPERKESKTVVEVEILVYSLKQNRLVWAGTAEGPKPDDVDDFVVDLTKVVAEELATVRLIPG
jgi:hypothetical protein